MGLISGIEGFFNNLFGGGTANVKKKPTNTSSPSDSPLKVVQANPWAVNQSAASAPNAPQPQQPSQQPDNSKAINLYNGTAGDIYNQPLQKAQTQDQSVQQPANQTTSAPAKAPVKPQPAKPGTNPLAGFGQFIGDTVNGGLGALENTVKLGGDVIDNGAAHLVNNKRLIQKFNDQTATDYNGSLVKPVANTVKAGIDLGNVVAGKPNNWDEDIHSSLLAPVANTVDATNDYIASNNAQAARADALQKFKAHAQFAQDQLNNGQLTPDQANQIVNDSWQNVGEATREANAATDKFSSLKPQDVASNAANAFLTAEPLIKAPGAIAGTVARGAGAARAALAAGRDEAIDAPAAQASIVAAPTDNTPAFLRKAPQTVGEAQRQAAAGIYNIPDETLSGDAHVNNAAVAPEDVPAFQRKNAEADMVAAQAKLSTIDKSIKDAVANGKSAAPFYDDRRAAQAEIESAKNAKAAQEAIDNPPAPAEPAAPVEPPKELIAQGQQELENFAKSHPEATQDDINAAHETINQNIVKQAQEAATPAETAPVTPETTPTPAEATPAPVDQSVTETPNPLPTGTAPEANPNPMTAEMPTSGQTAPEAPFTHDAATNRLVNDELSKAFKGIYKTRDVVNIDQLHQTAAETIDRMSPGDLAQRYAGTTEFNNPQEFINAVHALDILDKSPITETTRDAVTNLMDGITQFQSKAGTDLRIGQILWENMPTSMKKATMINRLTRNGIDITAEQEEHLGQLLEASDVQKQGLATAESDLARLEESIRNGTIDGKSPAVTATIKDATARYDQFNREQEFADGKTLDYYTSMLPKSAIGDRLAQDARVAMLSSVGGRGHDFLSTGAVTGVDLATDAVQAGLGKLYNGITRSQDALSAAPSLKKYAQGAIQGIKDTGRAMLGQHRVSDFQGLSKKMTNRSNLQPNSTIGWNKPLQKIGSSIKNVSMAATEAPTFMTQGRALDKLNQMAVRDGRDMGLKGQELKNFVDVNSRLRSKADEYIANQEHLKVNNLQDNALTRVSSTITHTIQDAVKGNKVYANIIPQVVNQVAPFTSWISGNISRTLTDANMLSNATRLTQAIMKGDVNGATKAAAHLTTNGGLFAAGALLTARGLISNTDAEGNSYAGAYFHIGNYYVPVAVMGPFAAPLIFGNAANDALSAPGGITNLPALTTATSKAFTNTVKSLGVTSTLGGSNAVQSGIANIGSGHQGLPEILAKMAEGAIGQYIPGVTGDINSVMDNFTNADPTHEAPDTKAYTTNANGNKVVDQVKTAENQLQARIPGLEQQLPRKAGVPAKDMVDRVTQGNHDSNQMVTDRATKAATTKVATDLASFDTKNDIPNPDAKYTKGDSYANAVEARIQRGEYDKAIPALQQKLDEDNKDKNIPDSTKQELNNKITQLKVAKDNKLSYADMSLYNKTSLTEWRNMGDPNKSTYNPDTYQKLFTIDSELAKAGVAGEFSIGSSHPKSLSETNKYSAKDTTASKKSAANKAARAAAALVKSNTLGSTPTMNSINFGKLAPAKISSAAMPAIQLIPPSQLIKQRAISVTKGT